MAVPQSQFAVRHAARNALTPIEQRVLEICDRAAEEGRELDSTESMTAAIGATGVSTIPGILKRLEAKGYIDRTVYQRGRRVCIAATGKCTIPPRNTAPHWRERTDRVQTPAIQAVRDRAKPVAAMIEAEARLLGKSLTDFLGDLVYIGWHEYQAEKEGAE
jgi:SOS-response transcriptional repressor LexA